MTYFKLKNSDRFRIAYSLTRAANLIYEDATKYCYVNRPEFQNIFNVIVGYKEELEKDIRYSSPNGKELYSDLLKLDYEKN